MKNIKIHYLNVGHGDCTIIEYDQKLIWIDINNSNDLDDDSANELAELFELKNPDFEQSENKIEFLRAKGKDLPELDNPIEYLENNFSSFKGEDGKYVIDYYIQTHPDCDHLNGLDLLIDKCTILNFLDTDNTKEITEFRNDREKDSWNAYQDYRSNQNVKYFYFDETIEIDEDSSLYIYNPKKEFVEESNKLKSPKYNNYSYLILAIFGDKKFLFGGDMEYDKWIELWDTINEEGNEDLKNRFANITDLKASHHGRKSGRCASSKTSDGKFLKDFLKHMNPSKIICSVGEFSADNKKDDALDWYSQIGENIQYDAITTREIGTISWEYPVNLGLRSNSAQSFTPIKPYKS